LKESREDAFRPAVGGMGFTRYQLTDGCLSVLRSRKSERWLRRSQLSASKELSLAMLAFEAWNHMHIRSFTSARANIEAAMLYSVRQRHEVKRSFEGEAATAGQIAQPHLDGRACTFCPDDPISHQAHAGLRIFGDISSRRGSIFRVRNE
jgi:hypothetical protein